MIESFLGVKAADDKRIQDMERSVIEKRDYVYRAHNEYVLSIREYNFTYERYICKIESLILYYEAAQFILNQQWFVNCILCDICIELLEIF